MVEDHHLHRAGLLFEQGFGFRVVMQAHLFVILQVRNGTGVIDFFEAGRCWPRAFVSVRGTPQPIPGWWPAKNT
ncbi:MULTISPECIES: hypothetical protein [unclassified Pseudomonas]|uniref:hypothetical protein n=1 Tax=unclassified Pseudomonas TaxID=196821 RepID=UPI00210A8251|nr:MULTISPECIES: hypothetical protein [unclassified Pseudomonas]